MADLDLDAPRAIRVDQLEDLAESRALECGQLHPMEALAIVRRQQVHARTLQCPAHRHARRKVGLVGKGPHAARSLQLGLSDQREE